LCPAYPKRPLYSGNGLGAPDTLLGHAGQKESLERAKRFFIWRIPNPFGGCLGNATEDALILNRAKRSVSVDSVHEPASRKYRHQGTGRKRR
jgi:hypothetical protein